MKHIKKFELYNSSNGIKLRTQHDLNNELIKNSKNKSSLNYIRELLKKGADPNFIKDNVTPLFIACSIHFYNCVKLLLEYGANVNLKNSNNLNAFYFLSAYSMGYNYIKYKKEINKIADILIEHNAELYIDDKFFWDDVANNEFVDYIKNNYSDKYNEYLIKKETTKYNL